MTELNDDPTIVTLNREREHAESRARPPVAPAASSDFGTLSAVLSVDMPPPVPGAAPSAVPTEAGTLVQVPAGPSDAVPPDGGAAGRKARLGITAGLVLVLLVVWIWQRRTAVSRPDGA